MEESTAHGITDYEPQHENLDKHSISFQFSLQILAREGLSVRGEASMSNTSTVPPRASRQPVLDIEQEYDNESVTKMPPSILRHRPIQPPVAQGPNTGPIAGPIVTTTHRVSGTTPHCGSCLSFACYSC